jgi:aldose 1-epimerase
MFCGGEATAMSISERQFGTMPGGEPVFEYTLANAHGMALKIINYGGIITQLHVPDRGGRVADVVLGFDNLEQYLAGHPHFGCITGRVAGRVTGGRFSLDGVKYQLAINDPPNHLHGGSMGFDKRLWTAEAPSGEQGAARVTLRYFSPDGEEGYPGNVRVSVVYTLTESNALAIEYTATTDKATPLSLTNHSYFNLGGEGSGSIVDHQLRIYAGEYAPADDSMTLLDRRERVAGQANDFGRPQRIGDALPGLWKRHGDHYFLRRDRAARLTDPRSGRVMTVSTTEPCLQFYTGVSLDGTQIGKSGRAYGPHAGLCLECQGYPNGVNEPKLGDIVLRPGSTYQQKTVYAFSSARPEEDDV